MVFFYVWWLYLSIYLYSNRIKDAFVFINFKIDCHTAIWDVSWKWPTDSKNPYINILRYYKNTLSSSCWAMGWMCLEEIEFSIRFRFDVYLNWWDVTLSAANVNTSLSLHAVLCSRRHIDEHQPLSLYLSLSISLFHRLSFSLWLCVCVCDVCCFYKQHK